MPVHKPGDRVTDGKDKGIEPFLAAMSIYLLGLVKWLLTVIRLPNHGNRAYCPRRKERV